MIETSRRWAMICVAGLGAACMGISTFFVIDSPPPTALAEGVYVSRCCGSITFEADRLVMGGRSVPYRLTTDNGGLAAVPSFYVGVSDGTRLVVDPSRNAMKMRFDRKDAPVRSVLVRDADASRTFLFSRRTADRALLRPASIPASAAIVRSERTIAASIED
ncbi:hypothetical protein [Sphingomonas panni]|uniref:hypothetical protein n=1 Tax=Sphingomonas panni TaxID=237612 RepID=UPI001F5B9C6D|nr:hypothetical protein [Sphingomonas panni]